MENYYKHRKLKQSTPLICFKHWSRKRFSILASQHKIIKIGVLCLAYSLVNKMPIIMAQGDTVVSQEKIKNIDEVEVDGRRSQAVFSESARTITTIPKTEIEKAGIGSIADILEYLSNIDIRQRGQNGIQADISLRGGSHDQVMVLVNGINLSDPQTGHFSLDIPIDPETIERIEICEGPAARTLGADAFNGAINIVTSSSGGRKLTASITKGKYGYKRDYFSLGGNTGTVHHLLAASRSSSEGYIENTAFSLNNLYYRGNLHLRGTGIDFQSGLQQKQFGAGGFYSPRFPDQYEETGTSFASLKATTGKNVKITPSFYWRRKKDHFLLIHDNPGYYENFHRTDVYGGQLQISFGKKRIKTAIGFDVRSENMLSNNMGFVMDDPKPVKGTDSAYYTKQYRRTNLAWFQEHLITLGKFRINAGMMINWNSGFNRKPGLFPGLDLSCNLNPEVVVYANINRVLHLPTFTDLFYNDPVNEGNFNLKPNRMFSSESGIKWFGDACDLRLTCFYNTGKDIIDWLWSFKDKRFKPVNLDHYKAVGLTSAFAIRFSGKPISRSSINKISVCYMFLAVDKSIPDSVSKYYNLKHKLSVDLVQQITEKIKLTWDLSFQDRYGEAMGFDSESKAYFAIPYRPVWLLNGNITWSYRSISLYAEVSNIFNIRYIDAGSAIQPGRWLKAGIRIIFL
jgi:vitamin B12 transporter